VLVWPGISLMTLAWISGIFLIVDAIFEFVAALRRRTEGRGLVALLGVLSLIAGLFLVRHPIAGVVAMTLLLGFWLIVFGVVRFIDAILRSPGQDPECGRRDYPVDDMRAEVVGERLGVVLPDRLVQLGKRKDDVVTGPDDRPQGDARP
jgi:hypothetical protein